MTKGIVRRIDELGRVVIPKELRRTMQIKEGEELEIVPDGKGALTIKKYSHFGERKPIISACARSLKTLLEMEVVIFDKNQVITHLGGDRCYEEELISNALYTALEERKSINLNKSVAIIKVDTRAYKNQYIAPIIINSELYGGVLLIGEVYDSDKITALAVIQCLQELLS